MSLTIIDVLKAIAWFVGTGIAAVIMLYPMIRNILEAKADQKDVDAMDKEFKTYKKTHEKTHSLELSGVQKDIAFQKSIIEEDRTISETIKTTVDVIQRNMYKEMEEVAEKEVKRHEESRHHSKAS